MSNYPPQIDPLDSPASASAAPPGVSYQADPLRQHRINRSQRLKFSILTSFLIKPLAFVIPIVTIPLFIKYLGSEQRYGLYESIGALVLWLSMVNVGLNLGLINRLTECDVAEDRDRARLYVSTLTWAMAVMLLVTVVIFSVVAVAVDWVAVFNVTEPAARSEAPWAVWVAGVLMLLGIVSGIPSAIYAGYQEIHRYNYWDAAAKISMLVSSVLLVAIPWLGGFGLVGVLLAASGVPVIIRVINMASLFWYEKPWLRPTPGLFDLQLLRVMLADGVNLFILQIAVLALFQADKLIIGTAISAQAVAGYAILGRLFLSAYGVFALILAPLWPAYGDAIRRGDFSWVKRQIRRTRLFGCGLVLACGAFMLVAGNWCIALLSPGADIHVSRNLMLAVTGMFMVRAWAESQSIALNAASVFKPQVVLFGGNALLNVIVAILLARPFGVEGVAWAASITGLLTSVWGYPWMIRKYIFSAASLAAAQRGEPVVQCRVCGSTDCEDCGEPAYHRPPSVAGVPIDISGLPLTHQHCRTCGYRFVHPPIPAKRLLECYRRSRGYWGTDASVAQDRYYARKKQVLEQFSPGRRILDFGCYDGGFLEYLGPDWERFGIEPSEQAAKVAASRGITILGPTIEAVAPGSVEAFAAIIVFDVIEHLNDPVATLRSLSALLKVGGIILIETGDSDSSHFKRVGKLYSYCGPVDHVGFFNRSSISQAGQHAGTLQLVHFEPSVHATYLMTGLARARGYVVAYWMLRALVRIGMPLPRRLADIAAGPVPRSLQPWDHFLAVLRKTDDAQNAKDQS